MKKVNNPVVAYGYTTNSSYFDASFLLIVSQSSALEKLICSFIDRVVIVLSLCSGLND